MIRIKKTFINPYPARSDGMFMSLTNGDEKRVFFCR